MFVLFYKAAYIIVVEIFICKQIKLKNTMVCAVCQIEADKKCTGCNEDVYCGKEHQIKHWPIHKNDCKCWKVIEDTKGVKGR